MNLATTHLGLRLPHPLMPGASPMVDDLGTVRRLEDAGAAAIVMHSLFEEQIEQEMLVAQKLSSLGHSHAEALSYFPEPDLYALGPDRYLEQIQHIKRAVAVPVIASLNGTTATGWLRYARLIEEAGADALELNVYHVATDPYETGGQVESRVIDVLLAVKPAIRIPVCVKLSPFYSSIAHLAGQLDELGVDGLVLFNRFYQPDIDPEELEVVPRLYLSDSHELLLRLRWLAVLHGRIRGSLAMSGGIHEPLDVVKAVLAGAHAVQVVSALLQRGPEHLRVLREGLAQWLEEHEYESLAQAQGSMSLERCPDPQAFERANYLKILQSWRS